jgi:DNA-directed RNA polymerase II subunit RPB2
MSSLFLENLTSEIITENVAKLQIQTFNNFLTNELSGIIAEESPITVEISKTQTYTVFFTGVEVDKPYIIEDDRTVREIYPNEARLRDLNYDSPVCINIKTVFRDTFTGETVEEEHNRVSIARLPIMLGSCKCYMERKTPKLSYDHGECIEDKGGYFIIKGKERVIVAQERANFNNINIFPNKNTKYEYIAEIRSMFQNNNQSLLIQAKIFPGCKGVNFSLPFIQNDIPAGVVFKAFGFTEKDFDMIIGTFDPSAQVKFAIDQIKRASHFVKTQNEALEYIGKFSMHLISKDKKDIYSSQILNIELFPHLGIKSTEKEKCLFLGLMVNKLICTSLGIIIEDDRDNISNKRIDGTGTLIKDLFRAAYKRFIRSIIPHIQKRPDIIIALTRGISITQGLKTAFATGNWGIQKNSYMRTGVSQILNRLSFSGYASHLNRLIIPIGKEGKNTKIRQLHSSQFGYICPCETPEGQSAGIVKNFALSSIISVNQNVIGILSILKTVKYITMLNACDEGILTDVRNTKIIVNGIWFGVTCEVGFVLKDLFSKRKANLLHFHVSISYKKTTKEIYIFGDSGRILRPLFVVQKQGDRQFIPFDEFISQKYSLADLHEKDYIRYIDSYEIEQNVIAMFPKDLEVQTIDYSYCEISPALLLGTCASIIPYPDHTQSPRNTYYAAMGKQALGVFALSNPVRCDTVVHLLQSPQKPIVSTRPAKDLKFSKMASGLNCVVAILCYGGGNQEDSVLLNSSSIQRGMFRSFVFKVISSEEKKRGTNSFESIAIPNYQTQVKPFNYNKLLKNGIVGRGEKVVVGDVIIGKVVTKIEKNGKETKKDNSVIIKHGEEGIIDKVFITTTLDGYIHVKVKIRSQRIPEVGDKFVSRQAQKGTCGQILAQEDMPFSERGIVPDIIVNPQCLPSRMTINMILELLGAKAAVLSGDEVDATPFSEHSVGIVDSLKEKLAKSGYARNGNEILYNGYTGEQLKVEIFTGPVYYQRLKHLVADKIHARDMGNVQSLTRQPLEGRSRDGGLRFGEMERDCFFLSAPISLYSGRSIKIGKMVDCNWDVLSWSEKNQYIEKDQQTAFKHKGMKPCVELTLQDGRKITCTHNHPLLTNKGDWVMANDFDLESDKLVVGKSGPDLDIEEEIKDCNGWHLEMPTIHLNTHNKKELLRSHAFARIIGMLITDGHVTKDGFGCIYLGHKLDVESFLYDLSLFCETKPNPAKQKHCYTITLPVELMHNINCLQGIVRGAKVNQSAILPEFIKTAPKPIIREFLGAFFGGDGHSCVLGMHRGKRDILSSVGFSWSRKSEHVDSLVQVQNEIGGMLEMFQINGITITKPKEISDSKRKSNVDQDRKLVDKVYESNLHISIDYLIKFYEEIGFRYCCHKSQRLEASVAYKRLRTEVSRQHNLLTTRVDELTGFTEIRIGPDKTSPINTKAKLKMPIFKAISHACTELQKTEPIVHLYGIPTSKDISDHLQKGTEFSKFRGSKFPNASEFLTEIGAIDWFKNETEKTPNYGVCCDDNGLGSMYMRVIDRRNVGEQEVCDITVKNNHNFLAKGVVSHNCMISHGTSRFLKERLYDMSDPYQIHVCANCGVMSAHVDSCHACKSDNIKLTIIPYACKLLFQELLAMGIKINLTPES